MQAVAGKTEGPELSDLIRLGRDSVEGKAGADKAYEDARAAFRKRLRGESNRLRGFPESRPSAGVSLAIFNSISCGAYVKPEMTIWYAVTERRIGFDWTPALGSLGRVQIISNRARDLWPVDLHASVDADTPKHWWGHLRRRLRARRVRRALSMREPHSEQAYELCTSVFSAVNIEHLRLEAGRRKWPLGSKSRPAAGDGSFQKRIEMIGAGIATAERDFDRAAQRYARGRYGIGMVFGVLLVGLFCIGLGIELYEQSVPAWYGVSLLAGGVGAVVSVLQRMASSQLTLDYDAGRGTLLLLGAVRPIIGAVFGVVLFCALEGGWLPTISVQPSDKLAFFAVLGFLAGFSERLAQDMLVSSAKQIGLGPVTSSTSSKPASHSPAKS